MQQEKYVSIYAEAAAYYTNCGAEYFRKRGLSERTIQRFGLGSSCGRLLDHSSFEKADLIEAGLYRSQDDQTDIFNRRAVIPIRNEQGEVVAFGGRAVGDYKPKYINSPTTEYYRKSELLFGEDSCTWNHSMIICEGYMDLLTLRDHGVMNTLAVLGTALTDQHVEKLKRHGCDRLYLLFDTDEPGRNAVTRSIEKAAGMDIRVPSLLPAKDPDEFLLKYPREEFVKRILAGEDKTHFLAKRSVKDLVTILLNQPR